MTTYSFTPSNLLKSINKNDNAGIIMCSNNSNSNSEDFSGKVKNYNYNEENSDCHILALYPEILTHIFKFLDVPERGRAAQVCTYWRDVVYDKAVWRGVEAKMHLRTSGNALVYQSLTRRGIHQIQILSLKRSLRELVAGLPGIVSLKLSGCYSVTDSTLWSAFGVTIPCAVSNQLTQLTTLDLSLCKQVSDGSLARIANRAPNLKNLELGGCCQISDCGLLIISWGLKKLQRLNLRSCYLITDIGIGFLTGIVTPVHLQEPRIQHFLRNLGLLENVNDKSTSTGPIGLDLMTISAVPANSNRIISTTKHRVKLSRPQTLIRGSVSGGFDQQFPKKQRLDEIVFVQRQSRLQQKCAICQQVDYTFQQHPPPGIGTGIGSSDNVIMTMSNSRIKLHGKRSRSNGLHSSSSSANYRQPSAHVQEYFFQKIGNKTIFGAKDLQFLGLQDCQKLSDECLSFIGQGGLPKLQSINLSFCIHISDSGLKELAKLISLSEVNLRSCDNVTDLGLLNLSDCGGRLKCLDVSFCDKVGNSGLGYISQYMTKLKTLSLSACDISDQGLIRVANVLIHLETLNLGQCSKITDEALKMISEKCVQIKYIDLYGCTQISKEGLNLILKMPSIKSLNLGLWHWR